jgi:hypothetical protein
MHSSSPTVGAIATALAEAQSKLSNPEKTLAATIQTRSGERSFRYASLASGLDLVRKALSQHQIAVIQTTAIDRGQIVLSTLLVHASGEWVSSLWPVCSATEVPTPIKGAALTYARRYSLFALVGIAGEDDLDAPDLNGLPPHTKQAEQPVARQSSVRFVPRSKILSAEDSAARRDRLLRVLSVIEGEDNLALWAHLILPLKNTLSQDDARLIEDAYRAKISAVQDSTDQSIPAEDGVEAVTSPEGSAAISESAPVATPVPKPLPRKRSKAHLAFVASQPCLVCRTSPCDAHHLKIAQPRTLGRKVSDEFTVPLCRAHHQELHRHGNENTWWTNMQIAPLPVAKQLWEASQLVKEAS